MQTTMTEKEADARIDKALDRSFHEGWDHLAKSRKPLARTLAVLESAMAAAESPEHVEMALKAARLQARQLAEGIALLMRGLKALDAVTDDEEVMALKGQELLANMRWAAGEIETARDEMRNAKLVLDRAEKFLATRSRDADGAAEDWAVAVSEFDRIAAAAAKELVAWRDWEAAAKAAVAARDATALDKLRRAPPPKAMLDEVAALPRNKPFAAFDKAYPPIGLPLALRNEMTRDREKAMPVYERTIAMAIAQGGIAKRVRELVIAPLDLRKALAALGLPAAALARLKAALDTPAAQRAKALDAFARAQKLALDSRQMLARLQKAGVL